MSDRQHTLSQPVSYTGKGLHTGANVEVTVCPAEPNTGIIFQRIDLPGEPSIKALAENVIDTSRGTTIGLKNTPEVRVCTIEHLMAALTGMGIDNALVKVNGPELPIMHGSAKLFMEGLSKSPLVEQDAERNYLVIKKKTVFRDEQNNVEIVAYPDDKFCIDVLVDYNSRILGHQFARMNDLSEFPTEIAPCRTFVFFHELETLLKNGLIKGGDLENAIVIMEHQVPQEELDHIADLFNKPRVHIQPEGILNNVTLRFDNEPARHKLLDLIGDLTLVGARIKGKIVAVRPGHHANTEMANVLRKIYKKAQQNPEPPEYDPSVAPLYDINAIKKLLPHRSPFLLVDKIIRMDATSVVGIKNVTMDEEFFMGHFPEEPVMPGVLQVEAMAQTGGILALSTVPDPENYSTYFLRMDEVRLKHKVVPGDTLIMKCELTSPIRRGIVNMHCQGFVGEQLAIDAQLMAQIVKNKG